MKTTATMFSLCWLTAASLYAQEDLQDDPLIFDKRLSQWQQLLRDGDKIVRYRAARDLGNIGRRANRALPALLEALHDENKSVRKYATWAVHRIGPQPSHVPALIATLADPDPLVRRAAARALGALDHKAKAALPALKKRRGSTYSCAIARIDVCDQTGLADLINALQGKGPLYHERRTTIIRALGRIGPRAAAALPTLQRILRDGTPDPKRVAPIHVSDRPFVAYAIARIDPSDQNALTFLTKSLESDNILIRTHAIGVLPKIGANAHPMVPSLIRHISAHKNHQALSLHVVRNLGNMGADANAALPALRDLLTDKRSGVRQTAALAIYKIEKP